MYNHRFSDITSPIFRLWEKNQVFLWKEDAKKTYQTLKTKVMPAPILPYPINNEEYIVDTNASNFGLGGILSQVQDSDDRVIAYFSKYLNKAEAECNYCKTCEELLATAVIVNHFHYYLFG